MIIHVKFRISIFIIFFFLSHSSESWCAPEIWCAPGAKSYIRTRGSDHAKKIVLDLRNLKMDRNFFTIIFFLMPNYPPLILPCPLNYAWSCSLKYINCIKESYLTVAKGRTPVYPTTYPSRCSPCYHLCFTTEPC